MAEEKIYKIEIAEPAKNRYHERVLPYLYENFSFERAIEIDENILSTALTLDKKPNRGSKEKYYCRPFKLQTSNFKLQTSNFKLQGSRFKVQGFKVICIAYSNIYSYFPTETERQIFPPLVRFCKACSIQSRIPHFQFG